MKMEMGAWLSNCLTPQKLITLVLGFCGAGKKDRGRRVILPLLVFKTDYLTKTLSAASQMVAPKSSTEVAPVKTP